MFFGLLPELGDIPPGAAGVAPALAAAGWPGDEDALDIDDELPELLDGELELPDELAPGIGLDEGADALAGAFEGVLEAGGVVDALDALDALPAGGGGGGGAFFLPPLAAANFDRLGNAIGS